MTLDELQVLVSKMNVPEYKRDLEKPATVKWLLENLKTRNLGHPQFVFCMSEILKHAVSQNWLKAKEARVYEAQIRELKVKDLMKDLEDQGLTPTGREKSVPEPQEIPRKTGTISLVRTERMKSSQSSMSNVPKAASGSLFTKN